MIGVEFFISASVTMAIDQASKKIVLRRMAMGGLSSSRLPVRIRCVTNAKVSQRLVQHRLALLFLWGLTVLSIIVLVHAGPFFQSPVAQVGLGVALGGTAGNLCDMLWRRAVIDFIDAGFWPVFNLADAAIVSGAIVALWFAG